MSYEVTATRRRPQRFEDLVGQEFVASTLKNSIQSGKIAHAYLFSGPRGCGKTSTARILAKALNCKDGPTPVPCGTCASCMEITKGSSMDVIEIDGASNTSVNDVRQIRDEVMFPPQSSKYKIYIIDEVHMLSTSAFNALLKTIEEPPPYVVFIFATTELQKVPATIKSRCQQFNFRLVPVEQVKELLAQAAQEVGIQADDEALYWIARESTGSIRDSYTLFDQVAAFSDGHITYDKIRDKLGLVGIDRLNDLFSLCAAGNAREALSKLDEYLTSGISIEQLISNSADYIRSLLLLKSGITKEALLGQSPERYSSEVQAAWNSVQIERALSLFLQLFRDIRYSLSPRFELELAFSRLCWLSQYVSPAEVKAAVNSAKALLAGAGMQPAPRPGTAPSGMAAAAGAYDGAPGVPTGMQPGIQRAGGSPAAGRPAGFPTGLPVFSALSGAMPAGSAGTGAPAPAPESSAETAHPFYDGGTEPPEQAEFAAAHAGAALTADIPDASPEPAAAASTDSAAEPEAAPISAAPIEATPAASAVPGREPAAPADIAPLDLASLRQTVLTALSSGDPIAASSLMQTGEWRQEGSRIIVTIDSDFKKSQLDMQAPVISDCMSKICGAKVICEPVLQQKTSGPAASRELPPQVSMLCRVFRGSVVGMQ